MSEAEMLAKRVRSFPGVTRKMSIHEVTSKLPPVPPLAQAKVLRTFGEDSALIKVADSLLLLSSDGIWHKLIEADPYFAGYCSVLVNVNDICCKSGIPVAMVSVIGASEELAAEITSGIAAATEKFRVPCVGGHYNPDSPQPLVSAAILGYVEGRFIPSDSARPGDKILAIVDLDGRVHSRYKLAWDTTTHKSPSELAKLLSYPREASRRGLIRAAKDTSNPGIVGTIGMMLEASGVGGVVRVEEIPKPRGLSWDSWLLMYPGFGLVAAAPPEEAEEACRLAASYGLEANVVGEVDESLKLSIEFKGSSAVVFDFTRDKLSGRPDSLRWLSLHPP